MSKISWLDKIIKYDSIMTDDFFMHLAPTEFNQVIRELKYKEPLTYSKTSESSFVIGKITVSKL